MPLQANDGNLRNGTVRNRWIMKKCGSTSRVMCDLDHRAILIMCDLDDFTKTIMIIGVCMSDNSVIQ